MEARQTQHTELVLSHFLQHCGGGGREKGKGKREMSESMHAFPEDKSKICHPYPPNPFVSFHTLKW